MSDSFAPKTTLPIARIDVNAVVDNFKTLQKMHPETIISAVVKSDSYGLGAVPIVQKLYDIGCRDFWVAHAEEGEAILHAFPKEDLKLYVLHGISEDSIPLFKKHKQLFVVLNSPAQILYWRKERPNNNPVILQLDTGLSRLGIRDFELEHILKENLLEGLPLKMVMSHLSCGEDKNHPMNKIQLDNFKTMSAKLPKVPLSLSASSGAFLGKDFAFDMIRAGAALYGINTAPYQPSLVKPVVFVSAPIIQRTKMKKGAIAGYGATYTAPDERDLIIVSIGYGDGFPKRLGKSLGGHQAHVFIFDEKENRYYDAPILGGISMDTLICDVTGIPEHLTQENQWVEILNKKYQAEDMGKQAGTIDYEILTRLGKRYTRLYS